MNTILAMVQADKEGEIESKMIRARQMEEIREARRVESEKKEGEKQAVLDETKDSLRKKRKRAGKPAFIYTEGEDDDAMLTGGNAVKAKKKRVSFA